MIEATSEGNIHLPDDSVDLLNDLLKIFGESELIHPKVNRAVVVDGLVSIEVGLGYGVLLTVPLGPESQKIILELKKLHEADDTAH